MSVFSENLKSYRLKSKLTQSELAGLAGCSQACIAQLENADRHPTHKLISALSQALKVEQSQLVGADFGLSCERNTILKNMNKMRPSELKELARYSGYIIATRDSGVFETAVLSSDESGRSNSMVD